MELMTNNKMTMSSYDFLQNVINPARLEAGQKEVRNNDFLARVEDELDDLGRYEIFVAGKNEIKYYELTFDQMMLVGMRESKAVRKNVLAKLKAMEAPQIPNNLPDALRLAADLAEENQKLAIERDEAIKTKALIGSKREATAMGKAGVLAKEVKKLKEQLDQSSQFSSIKRMEIKHSGKSFDWRKLKKASVQLGLPINEIADQNYGSVKTYHAEAWAMVYQLDIAEGV